jgi:hypothetical protein
VKERKIPAHHRQAFAEVEAWREDKKLFGEFSMFIKGFNDWVCKEWDNNVQKRQGDVSEADQEVIEDFIDIDTEEVQ